MMGDVCETIGAKTQFDMPRIAFQVWLLAVRGKRPTDPQSHSLLHCGKGLTLAAGFVVFAHFDSGRKLGHAYQCWGVPSTDNKHSTFNALN